jgi:hypothetical protein
VLVSEDLGQSWQCVHLPDARDIEFENCFTTESGDHLLQVKSGQKGVSDGTVFLYDSRWSLRSRSSVGRHRWHGSRSIGQSGNTIMWAEYPYNGAKYTQGQEHLGENSRVWRSLDSGATWEPVFEQTGLEIRHFHTIVPDPYVPRQWWLSSGDRAKESKVWLSSNDGDSWSEVTNPYPQVRLHPIAMHTAQAVHRYTDIWFGPDEVVWGTDDFLGLDLLPDGIDSGTPAGAPRAGARMFRSQRTTPLQPVDAGWIGNPVRSITDVGPALLITTESKTKLLPEPQVFLMAKNGTGLLTELCTIETFSDRSGFTHSRASAVARNGVFFSFRALRDLATLSPRILKWKVDFD